MDNVKPGLAVKFYATPDNTFGQVEVELIRGEVRIPASGKDGYWYVYAPAKKRAYMVHQNQMNLI